MNEPLKDRCPICCNLRSLIASTSDSEEKEFYKDLLSFHKQTKYFQKAHIRSHKDAVEPYSTEMMTKKWFD